MTCSELISNKSFSDAGKCMQTKRKLCHVNADFYK